MNCYEHTLIAKQDLQEKQASTLINKYEEIINKNSGKVIKIEQWGLKNLSRLVNNNKKGLYLSGIILSDYNFCSILYGKTKSKLN